MKARSPAWHNAILTACLLLAAGAAGAQGQVTLPPSPAAMMGGGNFNNGVVNPEAEEQFNLLRTLGLGWCRVNLYPGVYLRNHDWNSPNGTALDAFMTAAHRYGVTPMLLLEYYAGYFHTDGFGDEKQWFGIGKALAERCRPNGTWARENHIRNWGITVYSAMNEPETTEFKPGGSVGIDRYVLALKGLADGVHSVDRTLKVLPGGFMSANAFADWTLRGFGPALAPLWNDGTLDGIDLHTYFDVQYAPMENTYRRSAQNNFDEIKKACGITRDIAFYSTEFNYKKRLVSEEQAARGLLTAIWDSVGVVGSDGSRSAAGFALPWNIFNDATKDVEFGMRFTYEPLALSPRGHVLEMVARLSRGMRFAQLDPKHRGEFVLTGQGRKLWVWQDRKAWTDHFGTSITITGIPKSATRLDVYGWDGIRRTLPLSGVATLNVTDLPGDETYLFMATAEKP